MHLALDMQHCLCFASAMQVELDLLVDDRHPLKCPCKECEREMLVEGSKPIGHISEWQLAQMKPWFREILVANGTRTPLAKTSNGQNIIQ